MFAAIGIIVVLVMVFGGFIVSGGSIGVILHALPIEMTVIGGAAIGSTIVGHNGADLKALLGGFGKAFKGPRYNKKDFLDVIFLVSKLMKMLRTDGPVAVEPHIEDPKSSAIFAEYPKLLKDSTLIHLICDTLRLVVVSSGTLDPRAVEDVMDNSIKTHTHHAIQPANSLQTLADALPALGIVAAVLGVIKAMGALDQSPKLLGGFIGAALVGTFAGIFLSYGVLSPFAIKIKMTREKKCRPYIIVKQTLLAFMNGAMPQIAVEHGRKMIASPERPSIDVVENETIAGPKAVVAEVEPKAARAS